MNKDLPSLVFITGTDGSGKSCISEWLVKSLLDKGVETILVWSRFNNFFSKPLLALARVTGHNYYRNYNGIKFGFHDFEKFYFFRNLFAIMQSIDVNIATYRNIRKKMKYCEVVVCERGPWDTLMDVVVDTGLYSLIGSSLGRVFTFQVDNEQSIVLYIKRAKENMLCTRPELVHDHKLDKKIAAYDKSAAIYGWHTIHNDATLEETFYQISSVLQLSQ